MGLIPRSQAGRCHPAPHLLQSKGSRTPRDPSRAPVGIPGFTVPRSPLPLLLAPFQHFGINGVFSFNPLEAAGAPCSAGPRNIPPGARFRPWRAQGVQPPRSRWCGPGLHRGEARDDPQFPPSPGPHSRDVQPGRSHPCWAFQRGFPSLCRRGACSSRDAAVAWSNHGHRVPREVFTSRPSPPGAEQGAGDILG